MAILKLTFKNSRVGCVIEKQLLEMVVAIDVDGGEIEGDGVLVNANDFCFARDHHVAEFSATVLFAFEMTSRRQTRVFGPSVLIPLILAWNGDLRRDYFVMWVCFITGLVMS